MNISFYRIGITSLCSLILLLPTKIFSRDYIAPKAKVTPVIDGIADEECWQQDTWYLIDQTWDKAVPTAADFSGKFKLAWDDNKLYLFAEITDDVLNDNFSDPLKNYWEDDALEVFVDEDKSGGEHERNHNAFAYHISTLLDVADMDSDGSARLFNNHIQSKWVKNGNVYSWECAITVYTDKFVYGKDDLAIAPLLSGKKIGFALAYCDNDGSTTRESFVGSEVVEGVNKNVAYQNASVFGTATLVESITSVHSIQTFNTASLAEFIRDNGNDVQWKLVDGLGRIITLPEKEELASFEKISPGVYTILGVQNEKLKITAKLLKE